MNNIILELSEVIKQRKNSSEKESYTASLLSSGLGKCAEKFGEEAIELIIATLSKNSKEFNSEAADVLFHLLILIEAKNSSLEDVLEILNKRKGTSGLLEKALRNKN